MNGTHLKGITKMCYFLFLLSLYLSSNPLPSMITKLLDRINFSNKKVLIPKGTSNIFSNDNLSKFSPSFVFPSRSSAAQSAANVPCKLSWYPLNRFPLWRWEPDNIEGDVFATPWRFRYIRSMPWLIIVIYFWYRRRSTKIVEKYTWRTYFRTE